MNTYVSRERQPMESLFNWLIEKIVIQRASKDQFTIRSYGSGIWQDRSCKYFSNFQLLICNNCRKKNYFPIQKFLKMFPKISSFVISPVISPK
jgi:hypothetical protein